MSYCRWSTDDFLCDFYIYAIGEDEVVIHVATSRLEYLEPLPPPVLLKADMSNWDAYVARKKVVDGMMRTAKKLPIGLPHDGEDYTLSYRDAASKVRELIALGYRCDPAVADRLEADAPLEQELP